MFGELAGQLVFERMHRYATEMLRFTYDSEYLKKGLCQISVTIPLQKEPRKDSDYPMKEEDYESIDSQREKPPR